MLEIIGTVQVPELCESSCSKTINCAWSRMFKKICQKLTNFKEKMKAWLKTSILPASNVNPLSK